MAVIAFKILVAIGTALLGAWTLRQPRLMALPKPRFLGLALGLQLLTGLGLFVALYGLGHQTVPADVPGYYVPEARAALSGQLPYRDFPQSYAPLFPYVGAALLSLWNAAEAFVLFAIALNSVTLVLWHQVATRCTDAARARQTTILYATSGHVLLQTLLGTNQIWVAAALAGSALLVYRRREAGSGFVQAASACCTKLLAPMFWPVLWICAERRVRWLTALILVTAAVFGIFTLAGANVLDPLRLEGERFSSGNLPYLLEPLSAGLGERRYLPFDVLAVLVLAGALLWIYRQAAALAPPARARLLAPGLALTGLLFMLVSKKSISGYEVFFMYPAVLTLCVSVTSTLAREVFLLVFNVLLVAEPSLWFRVGRYQTLSAWLRESGGPAAPAFALLDLALVGCYAYLAWLSLKTLQFSVRGCGTERAEAAPDIIGATS